jgi:outer membrane biosynthesis protein TonB
MDAVTEVLIDRRQQADRLSQMMLVSLVAHATLLAVVALSPRLFPADSGPSDEKPLVISLAGGDGPVQGHNPQSAKPIQQVAPDPAKARTDTPPPLTKPELVESVKTAKPEPKAVVKNEPKKTENQLHGRTPTQGAEVRPGTARVDTGQTAPIPFGGLATGGGGNAARTDVSNFCCPEYLAIVQRTIVNNTNAQQGQAGTMTMKFVIHRDGTISDISAVDGNNQFLELAARRGLEKTQRLPPLPAPYPGDRLTVLIDLRFR